MKLTSKVFASLLTLLVACCLHAADSKPTARVMALLEVETDDPSGYASWIKEYNQIAKARLNLDDYLRVYETRFDGHTSGTVRVVTVAASVAELTKNSQALENDPAILQNREHLRGIRKTGSRILYQAVRFDGPIQKGANNYTTLAVVTDEPGYLKALDELRALFDANGLKDVKINAYRILAGRTDHTHRITLGTPSPERLAALLDLAATNPQMTAWQAGAAKFRSVVSNSTTREITK